MGEGQSVRPVLWVASARRDLLEMPSDVIDDFGFGLYQAQIGEYPDIGKALSGFGSANIIELVQNHRGDTFRVVYTVRFSAVIVVLHAFQKKSKKGSATPKQDVDLIHARLKLAEELYKLWKKKKGGL